MEGLNQVDDHKVFDAGDVVLESGLTLPDTKLVYTTHGSRNREGTNAVVFPTRYSGRHSDNKYLIGKDMALNPEKYLIIVPNLLGNGVSSSPSNTSPPFDRARFPPVTIYDNVRLQQRLLTEKLGVKKVVLAVGWSMGAQQAYQWAVSYPDMVEKLATIGGSARTSPHNYVFLEGVKAALTADTGWRNGWYDEQPTIGLRAMARVWAGWGLSQAFYRERLYESIGYASLEDFLVGYWEKLFLERDANNLLSLIWTWQHADISANEYYKGDFERALGDIKAKSFVMPSETDLYFPPEDSAYEVKSMPNAELRPIPSIWGHYAGGGKDEKAVKFIDAALKELLAE